MYFARPPHQKAFSDRDSRVMPETASEQRPIGVFDSGVGGLSVLREIRGLLPQENLIYVADSGHAPYGGRSDAYIRERALEISGFLVDFGVKAIVVACNTATSAAINDIRGRHAVPVVGMEPAVKPAAAASRTRVVGVLATAGTLNGRRFEALLTRFANGVQVITQPCGGLVEQIESGEFEAPQTRALVERYTEPLLRRGADVIILGCTHYPLIRDLIQDVVGPKVALLETGAAVARQLKARLEQIDGISRSSHAGSVEFRTTGALSGVRLSLARIWDGGVEVKSMFAPDPGDIRHDRAVALFGP